MTELTYIKLRNSVKFLIIVFCAVALLLDYRDFKHFLIVTSSIAFTADLLLSWSLEFHQAEALQLDETPNSSYPTNPRKNVNYLKISINID